MSTDQLTRADLAHLSPDEIEEARKAGRLDHVLGMPDPEVKLLRRAETEVLGRTDIKQLADLGRHDLIEAARAADRINYAQEN